MRAASVEPVAVSPNANWSAKCDPCGGCFTQKHIKNIPYIKNNVKLKIEDEIDESHKSVGVTSGFCNGGRVYFFDYRNLSLSLLLKHLYTFLHIIV